MSQQLNTPAPVAKMDVTYQIVTNLSCNLDCSYCYERKYPRNNNIEDVVNYLHACFDRDQGKEHIGGVIVDLIGGEPFMQPKLLEAAIETSEALAKRNGVKIIYSISTNGTLFNVKKNREIVERYRDKIAIGVSIDGLPESHDKYRIYTTNSRGSYEDAVAGYNYLKSVGIRELGVKATFTKETLPSYAAGMKHLIDITGGGTVAGNVIFEDILDRSMAVPLANQMIDIIDYWCDKGLHLDPKNVLSHLEPNGLDMNDVYHPDMRQRLFDQESARMDEDRIKPFCGSVKYMTCLGFDRKIYGCNRFMSTVTTRQAIGELVGREIVLSKESTLAKEIEEQYKDYSEWCLACPSKPFCGSCAAAPYENKDGSREARKEYHAERRQCGWTMGKTLATLYWKEKFGSPYPQHAFNLCMCDDCRFKRGEFK